MGCQKDVQHFSAIFSHKWHSSLQKVDSVPPPFESGRPYDLDPQSEAEVISWVCRGRTLEGYATFVPVLLVSRCHQKERGLDCGMRRPHMAREAQPDPSHPATSGAKSVRAVALAELLTECSHTGEPRWHHMEKDCLPESSQHTGSWEIVSRCCIKP